MGELLAFVSNFDATRFGPAFSSDLKQATDKLGKLPKIQAEVSSQKISAGKAIGYYTGVNSSFLDLAGQIVLFSHDGQISNEIAAYVNFLNSIELAATQVSQSSQSLADGSTQQAARLEEISWL